MASVFNSILQFGIQAGWIVLALIFLRLILRKAPRNLICALWALVAVRLMVPINIQSIFSLVPKTSDITKPVGHYASETIRRVLPEIDQTPLITSNGMSSHVSVASGNEVSAHLYHLVSVIWIAGVIIMLIYAIISFLRLWRLTRVSIRTEDGSYLCDRIPSPFILGVIRPKIFLPSNVSEHDKPYILAHEKAHIRRKDHLWKPLGFLLLSVYWFNPLLWVAYILLCRDIEMACDERVIKELGTKIKKPYAIALINSAAPRRMISACPLAFGETSVKVRIKNVLNYKKPAFWIIIVAVVLSIAVAICFLTVPIRKSSDVEVLTTAESELTKLEPNEAVSAFFKQNSDKFPNTAGSWSTVRTRYYGGSYLYGAEQVILLTDISQIDEYIPVGLDIRFEKCDYTYVELTDAISDANAYLGEEKGYGKDFVGTGLADDQNRIVVTFVELNDEKINWFKENVSDKDCFIFNNADEPPEDGLDSLTVSIDLPTITYADDRYIYLDGDFGVVIYDCQKMQITGRIPYTQLQNYGYSVPYSYASAEGKQIVIHDYADSSDKYLRFATATGYIIAMKSEENDSSSKLINDSADPIFEFDAYHYDIKYDENGKNISERIYRKGDTEYRLSVPEWYIQNTTITVKDLSNNTEKAYHIFE